MKKKKILNERGDSLPLNDELLGTTVGGVNTSTSGSGGSGMSKELVSSLEAKEKATTGLTSAEKAKIASELKIVQADCNKLSQL